INTPPPTEIYTLSLHDALPICTKDLGATINVKGYYPFISDSMKEKVISYDARWSQDAGRSEMESLVKNIEKTINENYKLQMYVRSEEHTSELQSRFDLVCRLLL